MFEAKDPKSLRLDPLLAISILAASSHNNYLKQLSYWNRTKLSMLLFNSYQGLRCIQMLSLGGSTSEIAETKKGRCVSAIQSLAPCC
jgi:hypothetical protein